MIRNYYTEIVWNKSEEEEEEDERVENRLGSALATYTALSGLARQLHATEIMIITWRHTAKAKTLIRLESQSCIATVEPVYVCHKMSG